MVAAVPGLADKVKQSPNGKLPPAWACSNGCDWVRIFGTSFWVDFSANVIAEDTSNLPCERAAGAAGAAAQEAAQDKREVKHGRLDVLSLLDKFQLPADHGKLAVAATCDEALMAAMPEDKVLILKSPDKIAPSNLMAVLRTTAAQICEHIAALVAASCADAAVNPDTKQKDVTISPKTIVTNGSDAKITLRIVHKIILMLTATQRGLTEVADYASQMHRTHYSSVSFATFMDTLHALYRKELHEVKDVLENSDNVGKDVSTTLDQNTFFILGSRVLARDTANLEAFFRKERTRYEATAKKCGWSVKPSVLAKRTHDGAPVGADKQKAKGDGDGATSAKDDAASKGGGGAKPRGGNKWKPRKKQAKADKSGDGK